MPKGETSRPLNATQRKAARTLLMLNKELENKSTANKMEIITGKRYMDATMKLRDADEKEFTRISMKAIGRKTGASKATQGLRKAIKSSADTTSTKLLKDINKARNKR